MTKLRGWFGFAQASLLLLSFTAISAAPTSAQAGPTAKAAQNRVAVPAAVPEADEDSADIPAFARGSISEHDYFILRDQEIRSRRGIDDLVRAPHARSLAVSRMEFQQNFLQTALQGLAPLSGLIPAAGVATWTPLGPDPIPNGQTTTNEVAVSGRVTAIVVDPTTEQTVYVGTAQGGVYRSTDGGSTWTALFDSAQSLAIGALALDPNNRDNLFIGTGEGNLSGDSFFGVGLYVITGASTANPVLAGPFNSNGASDIFTGRAITRILVNPADANKILVSTASGVSGLSGDSFGTLPVRGVFLSTNALGATPTFTQTIVQTGAGAAANRTITDMVMDPANPNTVLVYVFGLAAAGDGGLWMSTAGDPWAGTATWTQEITRQGFGKFAVNHVAGPPATTTYLLAQDEPATCAGSANQGSLRTSTDGVTWTALPAASGFCGGQCFYDMVPAIHPADVNTILLGGPSNSAPGSCSANVFARSTTAGASFTRADVNLHADFHALAFAPGNPSVVYAGNDGGIFRSADAGATWTSVNTAGFNATQFVSLSLHPTDPNFALGGTQDNGTEFMKPDGTWTRADFGDGGYSAIDQSSSNTTNVTMYHTYFNQTGGPIGAAVVTLAANAVENGWAFSSCPGNGMNCADAVLFYAPITLGPGSPNTFYFGTDHLYRSINRGTTMTAVSQAPFACCTATTPPHNFRVSAIGISPQDDNVRIVGLENGKVFATTAGANPMTDVTGTLPAKFVARAVIDPNNKTTAYVTLDGYGTAATPIAHVWKTTNLSGEPPAPTWTNSSTGLPDVPVNSFAVDPLNSNYLYAGTDIGVFNSIDGGATWAPYGGGLPRVAVFDLHVHPVSHTVRIGTHGRGAWEIAAAANFPNTLGLGADTSHPAVGASVTLTATVNKQTGIPVPTGTVTFTEGTTQLGSGALNGSGVTTFSTTTLTAGPHVIFATYGGDALYAASTSLTVQVNVGGSGTTIGVAVSNANPALGASITFTGTVNTGGVATVPTGTISFIENGNVLGTGALVNSTSATFQTSSLSAGVHNISASYSGDATYSGSVSAPVVVTVANIPPDFLVDIPTGSVTVAAGLGAAFGITVEPQGGFAGTVNFSCSGLPAASSCSFNPPTVTTNGSPVSTTLTISTTARSVASAHPLGGATLAAIAGFGFLGIVFLGVPSRRRRSLLWAGMMILAAGIVLGLAACGGGTPGPPVQTGTPAGTFNVTVTSTSGAKTHTSVITLVVQ